MTVPATGPVSLAAHIAAEFGGAAPHSISEYRGSGGTPATGPISWSDFRGTSAAPLSVTVTGNFFVNDTLAPYSTVSSLTANASGGSGTKTYLWARVSGDTFTLSSTTAESITASKSGTVSNTWIATYKVTVTDSTGSASVNFTLNHSHGNPV